MDSLVRTHGPAGLVDRDLDAFSLENFHEDHGRSAAAIVKGCPRPIEQHGFQWATVRTLKNKIHYSFFPSINLEHAG
jgi:hypothetical protein